MRVTAGGLPVGDAADGHEPGAGGPAGHSAPRHDE